MVLTSIAVFPLSLPVLYPCRKAHFISIQPTLYSLLAAKKKNKHTLSCRHARLCDLMAWSFFSSNFLATKHTFADMAPSMTFGETTQHVQVVSWNFFVDIFLYPRGKYFLFCFLSFCFNRIV